MKNSPEFKGIWIPSNLFFDRSLSRNERNLLVLISNFKECTASDAYLGTYLGVSKKRISNMIYKLKKMCRLQSELTEESRTLKSLYTGSSAKYKTEGYWVPSNLLCYRELNSTEKDLLVVINGLDNKAGCYASNRYLAKILTTSIRQTQRAITKLISLGLLEAVYYENGKRILKSNLSEEFPKMSPPTSLKCHGGIPLNVMGEFPQMSPLYIRKNKIENKIENDMPDGNKNFETEKEHSSEHKLISPTHSPPRILKNNFQFRQILEPNNQNMARPPKVLSKTSVSKTDPVGSKSKPMLVDKDHLEIFDYYQKNIFNKCTKSTATIRTGIPLALKIFRVHFGDEAKDKLLSVIKEFKKVMQTKWWQKTLSGPGGGFILTPKTFFSRTFIENKLLALTINPQDYDPDERYRCKRSTTEAERRKVKEANKRAVEKIRARSKERREAESRM